MWRNSLRNRLLILPLGVLLLTTSGCGDLGDTRPQVRPNFNPPPLDAAALSGGRITHWKPTPGLPADPAAKTFLVACRQISVDSSEARSAFVVIQAGKFGLFPLHALIVGSKVLVLPEDLVTMGMGGGFLTDTTFVFYNRSPSAISLTVGSPWAQVGRTRVPLSMPMVKVPTTLEHVMALPDLLKVFHARSLQRHSPDEIRYVKTIYDIREYQGPQAPVPSHDSDRG